MTESDPIRLSLTEYAVLGLLAEGPAHGFALAKQLAQGSDLGRMLTIRRPLVYRALDRLVEAGLARPAFSEPGEAGPSRIVHQMTGTGQDRLDGWLACPVEHVRDLRLEFLLKLTLLVRSRQSPLPLVERQREALRPTFAALEDQATGDHVELWRHHTAAAAAAFLDDLHRRFS